MSNESECKGTNVQMLYSLGNLKQLKKKNALVPFTRFTLLDKDDERRRKLVGRNYIKNPAHTCNYCDTCHFFSKKVKYYDSNKAKNYII